MRAWRADAVDRIRSLAPRRVLEIGVANGLLLSRLARDVDAYWGTDLSTEAVTALRRQVAAAGLAERVTLRAQGADVTDGLPRGHFDVVVLNSVVQYFPGAGYLTAVLRGVLPLLAPGGAVFLGDLRDLRTRVHLQTAVRLLARLGAGPDVPVGTPVAGRGDSALDDLVGLFVNTLVLRTDTSGDPTARELLARVRAADLAAYDHQDLPLERLVDAVNPPRATGRNPLFQVVLAFQNNAAPRLELPGLTLSGYPVASGAAKVDLSFEVAEAWDADGAPAGLTGVVEYQTELFDPETVTDLVARWERLVEAVAAAPDTRLSELPLLSAAERRRLVSSWQGAASAPAHLVESGDTLVDRFAAQLARTPDRTAVTDGGTSWTYRQLDRRAHQLAQRLAAHGAAPERLVALVLERSADLVAACLAVLRTGAGYVPVDPAYPAERVGYVLADAAPVCVLTTADLADKLTGHDVPRVYLDRPPAAAGSPDLPLTGPRPAGVAYVIYTSGSSGRPKGVTR